MIHCIEQIEPDLYNQLYQKSKEVDFKEFCFYISNIRDKYEFTWNLISSLCYNFYGVKHGESYYRRKIYAGNSNSATYKIRDNISEEVDKVKESDNRNQIRAYIRKIAREETFKDIALEAVSAIASQKTLLPKIKPILEGKDNEAILCLSDWHLGIECQNAWNSYNEEIAKERIATIRDQTILKATRDKVGTLHVLNLGDMIAGRIHLTLRLESRYDVITQIMKVSELLAELLNDLSNYFKIEYYACIDNHSRLDPNKNDSLDSESLARITTWYLKERLPHIHINDNKFGDDIITFNCKGYNILGVHGDKPGDGPGIVIDSISRMTESHYDLICTAHRHHFSCDEKNRTVIISNSSLMGTDNYSKNLRLSAYPSQNLILVTKNCVCEAIYRIVV